MITGNQIRAGRALIKWSANDLANASGIGITTIRRLEVIEGIPSAQTRILAGIKKTLEDNGVEFIGAADDRPGVRLKA